MTLIDVIDNFKPISKPFNKPTRVCIYDYYTSNFQDHITSIHKANKNATFNLTGDCCQVKVESGVIQERSRLKLLPQDIEVEVKAIEVNKKKVDFVYCGQLADISIQLPKDFNASFIRQGSVLCDPDYPVHMVRKFRARIVVYDILTPITKGEQIVAYTFSNKVAGKITSLEMLISQKNEEIIKVKPKKLVRGNYAQVIIKLEHPICLEIYKNNKAMGRVALRDGHETIAAGIVNELLY